MVARGLVVVLGATHARYVHSRRFTRLGLPRGHSPKSLGASLAAGERWIAVCEQVCEVRVEPIAPSLRRTLIGPSPLEAAMKASISSTAWLKCKDNMLRRIGLRGPSNTTAKRHARRHPEQNYLAVSDKAGA